MLKQFLGLAIAVVLLPAAAQAQSSGAIAGLGFYSGIMTLACSLFVAGAKKFEDIDLGEKSTEVDYSRRGFYVDAGVAYANSFPGSTFGPRIHVGYRCHPRFAAELEYEGLYLNGLGSGPSRETESYWEINYNGKVFLGSGRYQPFLIFGFGVASADRRVTGNNNTDVTVGGGIGIDAWLTDSIALSFDTKYTALTGGASDLGHLSIGTKLRYKF
jgi:hypothetical protein